MLKRSLRWTIIYTLEAVAVILALLIFAGGAVLWRLSQGPVPLDFMRSEAQSVLARAFEGEITTIGALEARFEPATALLFITARDVTVTDAGGGVIARASMIEAGLALDALLIGRVTPVDVHLIGGGATLVRRADGSLAAGIGGPEHVRPLGRGAATLDGPGAALQFLRDPNEAGLLGRMRRVRIENASMRVVDERDGGAWLLVETDLLIERAEGLFLADLSGRLATSAGFAPINAHIEASAGLERLQATASMRGLQPRAVAPQRGLLAPMGALEAEVSLAIEFEATVTDGVQAASAELAVGPGRLHRAAGMEAFDGAILSARFDATTGELNIGPARLASDRLTTEIEGRFWEFSDFDGALPRAWSYELHLTDGRLTAPDIFERAPEWTRIDVHGRADLANLRVIFDRLDADIAPIEARLVGEASLEQIADGRWLPNIRLAGPVNGNIAPADVLAFWPVGLADGARLWIDQAVISARIFDAHIDLDLDAASIAAGMLANERLTLFSRFDGAAFRYISTMSPVQDASGSGILRGNAYELTLDSGRINEMALREGFVEIPRLNPKGALARFGAVATATAPEVLALIDEPPLELATRYGLDPAMIGGHGDIRVEILRPMLSEVAASDIAFNISAQFEDVSAPAGFGDLRLTRGSINLEADQHRLVATGDAQLGSAPANIVWTEDFTLEPGSATTSFRIDAALDARALDALGVPLRRYVDGTVHVRAETLGRGMDFQVIEINANLADAALDAPGQVWRKPHGDPAALALFLRFPETGGVLMETAHAEGEGLDVTMTAALAADGRLAEADISRFFIDGFADLTGSASRPSGSDGALSVRLNGDFLNAQGLLPRLSDFDDADAEPSPPIDFSARFSEVRADDGPAYANVSIDWTSRGEGVETLALRAHATEGPLIVRMMAPGSGAEREFHVESPDFGRALRLFGLYENVTGGAVTLAGRAPALGAEGPVRLDIVASNFTLDRMPVLARVLAAGSFDGLAALLSGEGIAFETMQARVNYIDGLIAVSDAQAAGPALGVNASGTIDLAGRGIAMDGVLAPSYAINSLFGNLPLIGGLLVSRPGEGVIGVTFSVEGGFDAPTVFVNPLSALAPGLLRRIFEGTAAARAARQREDEITRLHAESAPPATPEPEATDEPPPADAPEN